MNYNFINLLSGFICLTENITKQRNNRIGNERGIPMRERRKKRNEKCINGNSDDDEVLQEVSENITRASTKEK